MLQTSLEIPPTYLQKAPCRLLQIAPNLPIILAAFPRGSNSSPPHFLDLTPSPSPMLLPRAQLPTLASRLLSSRPSCTWILGLSLSERPPLSPGPSFNSFHKRGGLSPKVAPSLPHILPRSRWLERGCALSPVSMPFPTPGAPSKGVGVKVTALPITKGEAIQRQSQKGTLMPCLFRDMETESDQSVHLLTHLATHPSIHLSLTYLSAPPFVFHSLIHWSINSHPPP